MNIHSCSYYCDIPECIKRQRDELRDKFNETIVENAALAEKMEPVAWLFQHDETGRTTCIDDWQVQNGFEDMNPRLQKIHPLYTLNTEEE